MHVIVTGSQGFIGSHLVSALLDRGDEVIVIDALTYAGDPEANRTRSGFRLIRADLCSFGLSGFKVDTVFHLAAESHVDRSIEGDALKFVRTNVLGTTRVLETLGKAKLIHVSTDEVTGDRWKREDANENSRIEASSPYSASKAAAELLVQSFSRTYAIPAVVVRPCNVYGPRQHSEKFIPRAITYGLAGKPIPIYGDGQQHRQWMYVTDCVRGLIAASERGKLGQCYCLSTFGSRTNIEIAERVAYKTKTSIERVRDRPGHDMRYAQSAALAQRELGWEARVPFEQGLEQTLTWYMGEEGRSWTQSAIARGGRW
jgi:dTDP-glucose 4,6-dehydratase